jgi:hypothetical protein
MNVLGTIFQYVDPGTGSLLTQLLLSILIGAGFYLMILRKRIAGFFRRWTKTTEETSSAAGKPEAAKQELNRAG